MAWWNIELWPGKPGGERLPLNRPRWMPKPYWQQIVWARIGYFLSPVAGLMILHWGEQRWLWARILGWAMFPVATVIWVAFPRIAFSRMKARLLENDHLLCLSCGYSLKGLPVRHMCPECGWAYDADTTQEAWRHWLATRKLPPDVFT